MIVIDARVLDALRRQHAIRRMVLAGGAARVGWKIGGAIPEVDAITGGARLTGYLTSATVLPDGSTADARRARELRAETEVLIALARDVAAGEDPVAVVGVAIELVDVARPPTRWRRLSRRTSFTMPRSSAAPGWAR